VANSTAHQTYLYYFLDTDQKLSAIHSNIDAICNYILVKIITLEVKTAFLENPYNELMTYESDTPTHKKLQISTF
jgi:hypothetical protein